MKRRSFVYSSLFVGLADAFAQEKPLVIMASYVG
jgi:hypothetical protein